jgi:hypothetical protein
MEVHFRQVSNHKVDLRKVQFRQVSLYLIPSMN